MPVEWKLEGKEGLRAHFYRENGESEPGVDWAISISDGTDEWTVIVRVFDGDVALPPSQQGGLVLKYLHDKLASGWTPSEYQGTPGELTIPSSYGIN